MISVIYERELQLIIKHGGTYYRDTYKNIDSTNQ